MIENQKAVVIGGSIAGLLSARVLADRFESVTIVESDKLPVKPEIRKGVPQSPQPHVLFTRGYRILEELFPGIGTQLSAAGALKIDWAREFHHFGQGGWSQLAEEPSEVVSFTCSRPLLEWTIRQRLKEFSQVRFIEQHRVIELLANPNKTQVTGVRLRSKAGDAVCALCPVYGQGMTVSALSAMVLSDWLTGSKHQSASGELLPSRFQKRLAKSNSFHWMLATGQDSRFPTTAGRSQPNFVGKLFGWYTQQVIELASSDAEMHTLFMEIGQLLRSPFALYHPKVILRVLSKRKARADFQTTQL
jgi:2-polyprenyl-6-methoxyphenol hydroxylase-like FAD-dependent oxidoreductase